MREEKFYGTGNKADSSVYNLPLDLHSALEYTAKRGNIIHRGGFNVNTVSIFWVISGLCRVTVNGEEQKLESGQLFYILYRENFRLESLSDTCHYNCIGFHGPLAEAIILSYKLPRFLTISDKNNIDLIWKELISLASSHTENDRRHIISLITDIFSNISESDSFSNSGERIIKQGQRLIYLHLSDPDFGVDTLCEILLVSRSHLTSLFNKYIKISPGREILNRRLARAYSLLRGTDYSIGQISEMCGFRDPKTFSRFIRRSSGKGPRDFRQQFREENETIL